MLLRRLRSVSPGYGNYCALTIPKAWVEDMNLHPYDEVILERKGMTILVTPASADPAKVQALAEAVTTSGDGGCNESFIPGV